jgi:protein-tyrosine phosphatase
MPNFDLVENLSKRGSINIEMVCHGNICRSPLAAAVLANRSKELINPKIMVSSSGVTNYHVGESAHPLSQEVWEDAGYNYQHSAKQFSISSFGVQDLILCMDLTNRAMLINATKHESERAKIFMLRQFDPNFRDISLSGSEAQLLSIPDPWGHEKVEYQKVLAMIEDSITGLLSLIYPEKS